MKHFSIAELSASTTAKARGIDNRPPSGVILALTALIEKVLDPARAEYGAPISVNSGFRCLALNKSVGGAPTSQHIRGEAADLNTGSREANKRLYEILRAQGNFDQLINEHDYSWIHVSYKRPPATNRRSAFKLPALALLLGLLLGGHSPSSAHPHHKRDSIIAAASAEAIFKTNKMLAPKLSRLANTDQTTLMTDKLQQDAVSEKKLSHNRIYQYRTKSKGKIKSPRR